MYRLQGSTDVLASMHFIASSLVNTFGWSFTDANYDGLQQGSWPSPSDPPPPLAAGDYIVVHSPASTGASGGDRLQIVIDPGAGTLTFIVHRLEGGDTPAWDAGGQVPAVGATSASSVITPTYAGGREAIWDTSSAFAYVIMDSGETATEGAWLGHMQSLVRDFGAPAWSLGLPGGVDPWPAASLDLLTGSGEMFDETDTPMSAAILSVNSPNLGLTTEVEYFGTVPLNPLQNAVVINGAAPTKGARGLLPGTFLAANSVGLTQLRDDLTGIRYLKTGFFAFEL